jgi:hypothetical protein
VSSYFNYSSRPLLILSSDKSGEQEVLTEGKGKSKAKVKTRSKPYVTRVRLTALPLHTPQSMQRPPLPSTQTTRMSPSRRPVCCLFCSLCTFSSHFKFTLISLTR